MDAKHSRLRHLAKTFTWRIVGTVDTILLGWLITGDPLTGAKIGGLELITKMVLYYFHERAWFRYGKLGREDHLPDDRNHDRNDNRNDNRNDDESEP